MQNDINNVDVSRLRHGINCERNIQKVIEIYEDVIIKDGDTNAMVQLAEIYMTDINVEFNLDKTIQLYMMAIDGGNSCAMLRLAQIFYLKIYGVHDREKSYQLLQLAEKNNNPDAIMRMAYLYGSGRDVVCDPNKMSELHDLANKLYLEKISDDSSAMIGYAFSNLHSIGVPLDKNLSIQLYNNALEKNNINGLFGLIDIFFINREFDKYEQHLILATEMGDFRAVIKLADFYIDGPAEFHNYDHGLELYLKAVKKKHPVALRKFAKFCKRHNNTEIFLENYLKYYDCTKINPNLGVDLINKNIAWNKSLHKWWPYHNKQLINDAILTILIISRIRNNHGNHHMTKFLIPGIAMMIIKELCILNKKIFKKIT